MIIFVEKHEKAAIRLLSDCKQNRRKAICLLFLSKKTFQLISEIRSLSADCLPSLLDASVCGVSANQLFGRSVANFFNLLRVSFV
ncbi:hypothetical protein ACXM0N_28365 [Peribacillus simplex]